MSNMGAQMTKRGKRTRIDARGPFQRLVDKEAVARVQSELDVITPEQRAKGSYVGTRIIVNNHDPIERWKAAGRLTQGQQVAIELSQRLWRLVGLEQRVTASYGERMPSSASIEFRALTEIEAREDLHRIQDYVPKSYWDVFENVCRYGMPAGVAGEALGFGERSSQDRAHQIVVFVADIIVMRERLA